MELIIDPTNKKIINGINKSVKSVRTGIRKGYYKLGKENVKVARREITKKNKTGRVYLIRLKGRIVRHRASAPGQFPAKLTGNLIAKGKVDFLVKGKDRMLFGTRVDYGAILEQGSRSTNLAPRPWLTKTVKITQKDSIRFLSAEINRSILNESR